MASNDCFSTSKPNVVAKTELGKITLYWDDIAESSKDVLTGYSDFEGYKIYKSKDGGETWGNPDDMIYDNNGIFVGWRPYRQFDLSAEEDSLHCTYTNQFDCDLKEMRGHSIQGPDPYSPWFNLGNDTGLDLIRLDQPLIINNDSFKYHFIDENVTNGFEYTYSIVAYDMGVEPPFTTYFQDLGDDQFVAIVDTNYSNPNKWAEPDGYASIENSKGTTVLDRNFVKVYPGAIPKNNLSKVQVIPNPYIVNSKFKETEHIRQIRFTNLTAKCTINIFTINGEMIDNIEHNDPFSGNAIWDLRTINNQEVAPGLYIFHILSDNNKTHIGKLAIIR